MQNSFSLPFSSHFSRLVIGTVLLALLASGILSIAFGFTVAHAAGGQASFSMQPVVYNPSNILTKSYFIFDGRPGIVEKNSIRVTNTGNIPGTANLYTVDATTAQTSGAVYLSKNSPRNDVGAWATLAVQQVTLNPGQSQIVSFQLAIPGNARSGQHLGGIVAENAAQQTSTSTKNNNTFQVKVKTLTIVAIQVNLPGTPVEQLAATSIQSGGDNGYQRILVGLNNSGNMMLKPFGSLQVSNAQGQVVKNITLKLDTFLPQTSITYPVNIAGQALGAGNYQAALTLTYGSGKVLHYNASFTITQQQLAQVFTSNKTQVTPGLFNGSISGLSPFILMGAGLVLLLIVGSLLYWFVLVPRAKAKAKQAVVSSQFTRLSQFKGPGMR
ncbi:MAG: WxL protein peptidoglycan domain-containing protein [Ktedonobacteraceae bacterium]